MLAEKHEKWRIGRHGRGARGVHGVHRGRHDVCRLRGEEVRRARLRDKETKKDRRSGGLYCYI